MLEAFIQFLRTLPFWAWVVIPAILIALVTLFFSRSIRTTLMITIIAISAAVIAAAFHLWEVYIENHFIGVFDEQGLPSDTIISGWDMFVHAWPVWSVPAGIIVVFFLSILVFRKKSSALEEEFEDEYEEEFEGEGPELTTSETVQHHLEKAELKGKLAEKKRRLESAKARKVRKRELIQELQTKVAQLESENHELKEAAARGAGDSSK